MKTLEDGHGAVAAGKPVTLKEVARALGVSHQLVSYALNGTGTASDETRHRIQEAAQAMGYRKNTSARAMQSGKFGAIALVLSTHEYRSNLQQGLWQSVHDELAQHDLHLMLTRLPDEKLTDERFVPKVLRELMCDGLLVDYTHDAPPEMADLIERYHLPALWLNTRRERDCIFPDDESAGFDATRRLLELGHTRVAYVDIGTQHYSGHDRRTGYERALREAGLVPHITSADNTLSRAQQVERASSVLNAPSRPTALLAYAGKDLWPYQQIIEARGRRVPRDFSLVCFEEDAFVLNGVHVTTALVPFRALGRMAVQLLRQKIAAPERALAPQAVPFEWSEGETCAPPNL